jgi:hypothetical protein
VKHFSIPAKKWNPFNLDNAIKSCVVFAEGTDDHFWIEGRSITIERRIFGQWALSVSGSETEWLARDLDHAIRVVHTAQSRADGARWLKAAILVSGCAPA